MIPVIASVQRSRRVGHHFVVGDIVSRHPVDIGARVDRIGLKTGNYSIDNAQVRLKNGVWVLVARLE